MPKSNRKTNTEGPVFALNDTVVVIQDDPELDNGPYTIVFTMENPEPYGCLCGKKDTNHKKWIWCGPVEAQLVHVRDKDGFVVTDLGTGEPICISSRLFAWIN